MNKLVKIAGLVGVLGTSTLALAVGGDFRSPIRSHPKHWGLPGIEQTWWYAAMGMPEENSCWSSDTWLTFYSRSADRIFRKEDNSNKNTTNTQSLAALIFGKESFTGQQSFALGNLTATTADARTLLANVSPLLGWSYMTPSTDYNEYGLVWGACGEWAWDEYGMWRIGASISVPFKVIEVEPNVSQITEETLEDVLNITQLTDQENTTQVAARLDFLLSLPGSVGDTLLRQGATNVIIASAGASDITTPQNPIVNLDLPAFFVTSSLNRDVPLISSANVGSVTGPLSADAAGTESGIFFIPNSMTVPSATTSASGVFANLDAQASLFLIPRLVNNNPNALVPGAIVGIARLLQVVQNLDIDSQHATDFFHDRGVSVLDYDRKTALGDIDLDLYMRYGDVADWFVKLGLLAKLPTGTKQTDDPEKDDLFGGYHFQTGNNRHFELGACISAGWVPWRWFDLGIGFSVHHAFARGSEKMPAAFTGATVKNLQGLVDAKVSWTYFTGSIDFGFHHPCNKDLGMDIGYEIFAKTKDRVRFENATATDLLARTGQSLSNDLAESGTNAMLHKFYIDIYNRWNFFEIYAGASQSIAGRNAMKETEGHIGFGVYF